MRSAGSDAAVLAESVTVPARFGALYDRHGAAVRRYLTRRVGVGYAEDLTGEVFVRAFVARGRFRSEHDSALPWLLGIASHVIGDHRRAERRRLTALERLVAIEPQVVVHETAGLAPALVAELLHLSRSDRDTLLLVVWGELSYEETAIALEVPVGTVRSRIARARSRLMDALSEERADGSGGVPRAREIGEGVG
jgi:RNA polymerase sigma-70 factor (ECF subfamily)